MDQDSDQRGRDHTGLELSVAVCTHNRPALVRRAIQSLVDSEVAHDRFEVILVDSASSSPPQAALDLGAAALPNFRAIRLEQPGISLARNTGLEMARGRILAYLDDDAMAPPNWLSQILASFNDVTPRPAVVAGPVISEYESPLPAWWPPEFERMLSAIPVQPSGFKVPDTFDGFAANLAFERQALVDAGGFSTKIGRFGTILMGGEETLAIDNIFAQGGKLYFCGTAPVHHFVATSRLNEAWLLRRLWNEGYTVGAIHRLKASRPPAAKLVKEAIKLLGFPAQYAPRTTRLSMAVAGRARYAKGFFTALANRAIGAPAEPAPHPDMQPFASGASTPQVGVPSARS